MRDRPSTLVSLHNNVHCPVLRLERFPVRDSRLHLTTRGPVPAWTLDSQGVQTFMMQAGPSRSQAVLGSPHALGIQTGPLSGGDTYTINFISVEGIHHFQRRIDAAVFINPLGLRLEPAAKTSCQSAKTVPEICLFSDWQGSGQYE